MFLLLSSVLLLSLHCTLGNGVTTTTTAAAKTTAPVKTFTATDPNTGKQVECDYCPPGTYLFSRCTATQKRVCKPCPAGTYTELWNYIDRCLRCKPCGRYQELKKDCSADSDRQCKCKQGYYMSKFDMCLPKTKCPPGKGVQTKGTPTQDTVCQVCPDGTYSDKDSDQQSCMPHQNCEAAGMHLVLKGSVWHDSVCTNCEELKSKDGAEYLREILPAFFVHQKMKVKRLRQIVHELQPENDKKQEGVSDLLARINTWIASATAQQLQDLPRVLTEMGATRPAKKLRKKLQRIDSLKGQCLGVMNGFNVD